MGQLLHGSATTTHRIRKEIQASNETAISLAAKFNINVKTVHKWRSRDQIEDSKFGPKKDINSVLTLVEQKIICETRRVTQLPLDDLLEALKPEIPSLSRSNLHRCLQRNNISRLESTDKKEPRKQFKKYPPGYLHIDNSTIYISKAKYYLFVAIDRFTKYVYVECHPNKNKETAHRFLQNVLIQYPFKIEKILTDNGLEFTYNSLPESRTRKFQVHVFDQLCRKQGIEHRLTQFRHPWTNGYDQKVPV